MSKVKKAIRLKNRPGRIHVVREPELSLIHTMVPKEVRSALNIELYRPLRAEINFWHLEEHFVIDLRFFKPEMEAGLFSQISWDQFPGLWIDLAEDAISLEIQIWILKWPFRKVQREECAYSHYQNGLLMLKTKGNSVLFSMKKFKAKKLPDKEQEDQGAKNKK